jgi:hypothetical protein
MSAAINWRQASSGSSSAVQPTLIVNATLLDGTGVTIEPRKLADLVLFDRRR